MIWKRRDGQYGCRIRFKNYGEVDARVMELPPNSKEAHWDTLKHLSDGMAKIGVQVQLFPGGTGREWHDWSRSVAEWDEVVVPRL